MKPFWSSKSPKIATALAVAYTFIQVCSVGALRSSPRSRACPLRQRQARQTALLTFAAHTEVHLLAESMQGTVIINLLLGIVINSLEKMSSSASFHKTNLS